MTVGQMFLLLDCAQYALVVAFLVLIGWKIKNAFAGNYSAQGVSED